VIIYAPHITEVSYTHGKLIDEVGYHVRDYFMKQPERFRRVPGSIKAHSSHVKGAGSYDAATGIESPRIAVTLATGIPEERCRRINLGYLDYRDINPREWEGRQAEGRWAWLVRLAEEAHGLPRHLSQHSGGMIVATRPLPYRCSFFQGSGSYCSSLFCLLCQS
jgi:hypothetical protein